MVKEFLISLLFLLLLIEPPFAPRHAWNQSGQINVQRPEKPSCRIIPGYRRVELPASFQTTSENVIIRPETLYPFFDKIDADTSAVRIVHVGDSHVRSHIFTVAAKNLLESAFGSDAVEPDTISYKTTAIARETGRPGVVYHAIGINGATASKFVDSLRLAQIRELKPDLLILSFGTNECHTTRSYSAAAHRRGLNMLIDSLQAGNPGCPLMLTTPPGAYIRVARGKRIVNIHTTSSVATINSVAKERELALWDLYNIAGGEKSACRNWSEAGLYKADRLHFIDEGYMLQGGLLATAILKAYESREGKR